MLSSLYVAALLALSGPSFAADAVLCLDSVPPPPDILPTPELLNPDDPPMVLVPVDFAKKETVRAKGRFYDERGRVYKFSSIEEWVAQSEPETRRGTAKEYYVGTWKTVVTYDYDGKKFVRTTKTVPAQPDLWRAAKSQARTVNRRGDGDGAPRGANARFREALCTFHRAAARSQEVAQEAEARMTAAEAARGLLPPDVPMSTFVLCNRVYAALNIDAPAEPEALAADVAAVWRAYQELGDINLVISRAAVASGANLSERLEDAEKADNAQDAESASP